MLEKDWNPALSANTVTLDDFVVADYYAETLTNFVKFGYFILEKFKFFIIEAHH
jgi:hypothetical protein